MVKKEMHPVGKQGTSLGEYHWNAKISDATVEAMRDLFELENWTVKRIAKRFKTPYKTVYDIVHYLRRACTPERYARRSAYSKDRVLK